MGSRHVETAHGVADHQKPSLRRSGRLPHCLPRSQATTPPGHFVTPSPCRDAARTLGGWAARPPVAEGRFAAGSEARGFPAASSLRHQAPHQPTLTLPCFPSSTFAVVSASARQRCRVPTRSVAQRREGVGGSGRASGWVDWLAAFRAGVAGVAWQVLAAFPAVDVRHVRVEQLEQSHQLVRQARLLRDCDRRHC